MAEVTLEGAEERVRARLQLEADLLHQAAEEAQQKVRDFDRAREEPLFSVPPCEGCAKAERHLRRVQG